MLAVVVAEAGDLVILGERFLEQTADPHVVVPPGIETVPFCVREPVVGERFLLAGVLAEARPIGQRAALAA